MFHEDILLVLLVHLSVGWEQQLLKTIVNILVRNVQGGSIDEDGFVAS